VYTLVLGEDYSPLKATDFLFFWVLFVFFLIHLGFPYIVVISNWIKTFSCVVLVAVWLVFLVFHVFSLHSLLGLICVPSVVRLFRESKLLASATFLLEKKGKVYLEDCERQRALYFCVLKKTWCWLVIIPVLVFDCVALRFREGISGLLFRANPLHGVCSR
jgi:hypothetical protein